MLLAKMCYQKITDDKPQNLVIHPSTQEALTRNHMTNYARGQGQFYTVYAHNYILYKNQPLSSQGR